MPTRWTVAAGWAVAALTSSATGCGGSPPPPSQFPTADDALGRMKEQYSCVNGVQGTAKIDSFNAQGRVRGDVDIFAVNPARVRFDVVSPFGLTLFTLTSNGTDFTMLDNKEKRFMEGPAKACNLARLTRVPVPGHALVSLLRGEAPVLVHTAPQAQLSWDRDEKHYVLVIQSKHGATQEIHLEVAPDDWERPWNQQRVRITQVKVDQQGLPLYLVTLKDHVGTVTAGPRVDPDGIDDDVPPSGPACSAEIPTAIRMQVPHTEQDVIFKYTESKWNPPLIDGAFTQPVPGGVTVQYVDCE